MVRNLRTRKPWAVDAMTLSADRLNRIPVASLSSIIVVTLIPVPPAFAKQEAGNDLIASLLELQ
ncbi:MAG: hypothetical protein DLM72_13655 [Candidatus Nitrosopolaris wilkensis]|nr:MAG: hypothetical protein DLM72_13655 [Candidatus Nitrosopolaris wilkensis]